jgi:uncharacterized membrane protein YkoI
MTQMTELSSAVQPAFIFVLFNGVSVISKQQNRTIMKIKMIICAAVAAALLAGCCTEKGEAKHHNQEAKQAKLATEAKVSKDDAEKTALAKVPNGTIKEAEIEKERGKLIWSFDVATPNSKDITEVNVDAVTGEVVSVEKESAESEAKEAAGGKDKDKD